MDSNHLFTITHEVINECLEAALEEININTMNILCINDNLNSSK